MLVDPATLSSKHHNYAELTWEVLPSRLNRPRLCRGFDGIDVGPQICLQCLLHEIGCKLTLVGARDGNSGSSQQ